LPSDGTLYWDYSTEKQHDAWRWMDKILLSNRKPVAIGQNLWSKLEPEIVLAAILD